MFDQLFFWNQFVYISFNNLYPKFVFATISNDKINQKENCLTENRYSWPKFLICHLQNVHAFVSTKYPYLFNSDRSASATQNVIVFIS